MQEWFDKMSKFQRFVLYGLIVLFVALTVLALAVDAEFEVKLLFEGTLLILVVYLHWGLSKVL